jgi:hypothetical protein
LNQCSLLQLTIYATVNDVAIDYMKRKFKDKKTTILEGEFLHMRCAAHILNLVVNEGLKKLGDCVSNIRNAVKFVRSSPQRMARFKECIKCEKIQCTKTVSLDVQTRWNSTYLMLSSAEKYEKAFTRLGEEDGHPFVVPSYDEWENAREFVKFLKPFYKATLNFSASTHVTSNLYFIQLCIIIKTLSDGCLSSNPILSAVSWNMKRKYEKYWGTMDKVNLLLYVVHALDPRTKFKGLQYSLVKCSGPEWAKEIETNVKDLLNRLWEQYNKLYGGRLSKFDADLESSTVTSIDASVNNTDDTLAETEYMNDIFQHLEEENNSECMSEVDRYFLDGCETKSKEFDILLWWKTNAPKYPILAEIARDILAIPISTVASESSFSNGGCILDPFRSLLCLMTVEALICTQDWLKGNQALEYAKIIEIFDEHGK